MREVYVGIDVHKDENVFGSAFDGRAKGELIGKCSADMNRTLSFIRSYMKKNELTKEQLHICYEAGPTGFVLARRLISLGFDSQVIAPSKIPQRAGDKIKSDRLDACKLARLHRAGELVAVHIPDMEDEVIRDVCRGRTDASNELKRTKQQLKSFMLRNGYRYTGTANWSEAHMRYLRELVMPHRAQKMVMEEYLLRIDTATAQVVRIDDQMNLLLQTWSRRPFVEALMGFRGFQAHRAAKTFRKHDERALRELAGMIGDKNAYISTARQRIADLEELMQSEDRMDNETRDLGWDTESLRKDVLGRSGD